MPSGNAAGPSCAPPRVRPPYIYIYIYTYISYYMILYHSICIYIYIYTHIHLHIHMCVYIYIYIYIYMYTHVYIYIYIHMYLCGAPHDRRLPTRAAPRAQPSAPHLFLFCGFTVVFVVSCLCFICLWLIRFWCAPPLFLPRGDTRHIAAAVSRPLARSISGLRRSRSLCECGR